MYAVVWIQNFSLQSVLRSEPFERDTPVVIVRETAQRSKIFQVNSIAARYGVRPDQSVSQALAKCGQLQIRPKKPKAEKNARTCLYHCLYKLTPLIEASAEDRYTLQLSGIPEDERKSRIHALLQQLKIQGFHPQIGVASASNWAHYAAKCTKSLLWVDSPQVFFNQVSITTALEDEELQEILDQWGIRTLGEFSKLSQQAIGYRLGKRGLELWQSLHRPKEHILKIQSLPQVFSAEMDLEYTIHTLEPLTFILNRLIDQLCLQLENQMLQSRALIIDLSLEDKSHYRRVFKLPEPTTNRKKIEQVLHTHLENLQTGSAIHGISLEMIPVDAKAPQRMLFQQSVSDTWKLDATLHQLIGLLGSENVGSPRLKDTHEPDTFALEPLNQVLEEKASYGNESSAGKLRLQRFRPPLPAQVKLQNGFPKIVKSSLNDVSEVVMLRGPWHHSGNWWDNRKWKRIEWDIEIHTGSLLRLVYSNKQWFIEGAYS
jgi:nucleotidyltransferase/DNA polymerase involved in DNA repair